MPDDGHPCARPRHDQAEVRQAESRCGLRRGDVRQHSLAGLRDAPEPEHVVAGLVGEQVAVGEVHLADERAGVEVDLRHGDEGVFGGLNNP